MQCGQTEKELRSGPEYQSYSQSLLPESNDLRENHSPPLSSLPTPAACSLVFVCGHMTWHMCGCQWTTLWSGFSPSIFF